MACPATVPITMADVRAEHGGTTSNKLSDYVRGGAFVPNIPVNNSVPTSVPITLSQLCGSQAAPLVATLSPTYLYKSRVGDGYVQTANCTVSVTGSKGTLSYSWVFVSGSNLAYCDTPSASATFFWTDQLAAARPIFTSYWKCTVTDSIRGSVDSDQIEVVLERL